MGMDGNATRTTGSWKLEDVGMRAQGSIDTDVEPVGGVARSNWRTASHGWWDTNGRGWKRAGVNGREEGGREIGLFDDREETGYDPGASVLVMGETTEYFKESIELKLGLVKEEQE